MSERTSEMTVRWPAADPASSGDGRGGPAAGSYEAARCSLGGRLVDALLDPAGLPMRLIVGGEKLSGAPAQVALARMERSPRPIVVGPWLSEIGFEILYWIPFLQWVIATRSLDPRRLVVVSRGGTAGWYRGISDRYFDVLDFYSLDELRARNEQRIAAQGGSQKHEAVAALDRDVVERVRRALGAAAVEWLHPSLMNRFFRSFWQQRAGMWQVERVTRYRKFELPEAAGPLGGLPDEYVAVKFYFNESFPDTPENRAFVGRLLGDMSARTHVVVLNTGLRFDEHRELEAGRSERLRSVDHLLTARDNLEVQSAIVARARAFYGTYGGFSYLAPLYGVDSVSFYSERSKFNGRHLDLAGWVFGRLGGGSFTALDVRRLDPLRQALGAGRDEAWLPEQVLAARA